MIDTIATRAVDQNEKVLTDLAKKIWENPETAFNEVKACEWTAKSSATPGFEVETVCGNAHSHPRRMGKRSSGDRFPGRV